MGYQSIVFGRIVIENNLDRARAVINSLGDGPGILRTEMFGLGVSRHTYYEDPVISFGATYKSIEDNWDLFILDFEELLRQFDFDTAKIQLETEILGTYNFFWKSKKSGKDNFDEKDKMIETDEWFFGFGNRSRWGTLASDLTDLDIFSYYDFEYPVKAR
ncbi:hypothetical protein [Mucilaginibacter kameinonensis]|uniref:hypothetical protein n=1 Tax=Mucilaginibacter kameinonensis TaxID=452286 RepID=UPI000EF7AADA|nr:hypothetical protein [Mucilaginibacter kameinonensis]